MKQKLVLIVLDSAGIGELPDADKYGDNGSNTIGNIAKQYNLEVPNMQKLGLGNIENIRGIDSLNKPIGAFGKMAEVSPGKDTTTGHWEIAGIVLNKPFNTYPNGFPKEIIDKFEEKTNRKILGNKVASGTEIIKELGEEHIKTGRPIVYTSADSVFQIAAHEEIISLEELYDMCKIAREILQGEYAVGRVIARPFIGNEGNYQRTVNRHDYSLIPPKKTILDILCENNFQVFGIGKIYDIYAGQGITKTFPVKSNDDAVNRTIEAFQEIDDGLVFANLVDFDSKFGHRNDVEGYAKALEEFDKRLPELINMLGNKDILIITADHGCDPTTESTDHSREYVPLLIYGKRIIKGKNLDIRKSFADLGKTIADLYNVSGDIDGDSFLNDILNDK